MKTLPACFLILVTLNIDAQVKSKTYNALLKTMLSHSVEEVSVQQAAEACDSVLFLDAREPNEYEVSRISGARHVGYDDFDIETVKDIPRDEKIVVYCSIGYRSEKIAEKLKEQGYTNVSNLYGGIFEWKNQDQQVVNAEGDETENVHGFSRVWGVWLKKGNKVYD